MPTFSVLLKIYGEKRTHNLFKVIYISLLFKSFINVNFKLLTKTQITQQYNQFELKNTCRIKEIIVKGKYNNVFSKEDHQKNELKKHCSKFHQMH